MNQESLNAVNDAKNREHNAYEIYTAMSMKATNEKVKKILLYLAVQEIRHERLLQEILHLGSFAEAKKRAFQENGDDVKLVEKLELSQAVKDLVDTFFDLAVMIKYAIGIEQKLFDFYQEGLSLASSDEAKALFVFLRDEEARHKVLLEEEYEKLKEV